MTNNPERVGIVVTGLANEQYEHENYDYTPSILRLVNDLVSDSREDFPLSPDESITFVEDHGRARITIRAKSPFAELYTLQVAIGLRERSLKSQADELELSIGVGYDNAFFEMDEMDPDLKTITPEGISFTYIRRIQELAAKYAPDTLIMATLDVKEVAQRLNPHITFGQTVQLTEDEETLFGRRTRVPYLYPVTSY